MGVCTATVLRTGFALQDAKSAIPDPQSRSHTTEVMIADFPEEKGEGGMAGVGWSIPVSRIPACRNCSLIADILSGFVRKWAKLSYDVYNLLHLQ